MATDTKTKLPHITVENMEEAGLQFGHTVSRLHPKMKPYVSGIKNNVHIIDLKKTAEEFEQALKYIAKVAAEGKVILFVGTKPQIKQFAREAAEACGMPYVCERWLGGTFTNFETISKRVQYFKDLEIKRAQGFFEKHTKKERLNIDKEIASLKVKFEGIRTMDKLPEVALILDMREDETAVREARRKGVKIVGIADTNVDPTAADYPIYANDDAISSVRYILEKVKETILATK